MLCIGYLANKKGGLSRCELISDNIAMNIWNFLVAMAPINHFKSLLPLLPFSK